MNRVLHVIDKQRYNIRQKVDNSVVVRQNIDIDAVSRSSTQDQRGQEAFAGRGGNAEEVALFIRCSAAIRS
jgi:hypothetical protein